MEGIRIDQHRVYLQITKKVGLEDLVCYSYGMRCLAGHGDPDPTLRGALKNLVKFTDEERWEACAQFEGVRCLTYSTPPEDKTQDFVAFLNAELQKAIEDQHAFDPSYYLLVIFHHVLNVYAYRLAESLNQTLSELSISGIDLPHD